MAVDLKDQPSLPASITPPIVPATTIGGMVAPPQLSDPAYRAVQREAATTSTTASADVKEVATVEALKAEADRVAREAEAKRLRYLDYMRRNPYRAAPVNEEEETKAPTTEEELKAETRRYLTRQELRAETRDYYLRKSVIKTPSTFAELQASLQASNLPAVFLFLPLKSINPNVGATIQRYTNFANNLSSRANFYLLELDDTQFVNNALVPYGNMSSTIDVSTIKYPLLSILLPNEQIERRIAFGPYPVEDSGEGFNTIESLIPNRPRPGDFPPISGEDVKYNGPPQPKCPTDIIIWVQTNQRGLYLNLEEEAVELSAWPDVIQTRIMAELDKNESGTGDPNKRVVWNRAVRVGAAAWEKAKKRYYGMLLDYKKLIRPGSEPSEAIIAENWFGEEIKCGKLNGGHFTEWAELLKTTPLAAPPSPRPGPSPILVGTRNAGGGGGGGAPPLLFGLTPTRAAASAAGIMPPYTMPSDVGAYPSPIFYSSIDYSKGQPYATYLQVSSPMDPESKNVTYTLSPPRVQYSKNYSNGDPMIAAFTNYPELQQVLVAAFEQTSRGTQIYLNLFRRDTDKKEVAGRLTRSGKIRAKGAALPPMLDMKYLETVAPVYPPPSPSAPLPPLPPLANYTPPSLPQSLAPNTLTLPRGIPYSSVPEGEDGWFVTYTEDALPFDPTSLNYKYSLSPVQLGKLNHPYDGKELDVIIRRMFTEQPSLNRLVSVQIQRRLPADVSLTFSQYGRNQNSVDVLRRGRTKATSYYLPSNFTTRDLEQHTQLVRT